MDEIERFKLFKSDCQFWIDQLYMNDYRFDFALMDDMPDDCAACSYVLPAHHAYMQLSEDENDPEQIKDASLHEVLEALLMPMKLQSINTGDVFHHDVQRETHAVIHRLMKILRGVQ